MAEHNIYDKSEGVLWKDENFDLTTYRGTGAVPPDPITIPGTNIQTICFDGGTTVEDVSVCKELNHDYQEGTPIGFHVHWYPTTTASGNVKWNIEYWITNQAHSGTTVSGIISQVQAANNVAWAIHTANFDLLSIAPLDKIGSQVHFRLYRNPADSQDTYGADAAVATVGWHYKTNSRGSSQITSK